MIKIKKILIKAYNNVKKIEKYYALLRCVYEIIRNEIRDKINLDSILQIAIKIINNTANLNSLILILFVFEVYPRIIEKSTPSPSII